MEELLDRLRREGTLRLDLRIRPGSERTEIVGEMPDGSLKIRVRAAPEGGRANEELVRFLAEACAVPVHHVTLLSGEASRRKVVRIIA